MLGCEANNMNLGHQRDERPGGCEEHCEYPENKCCRMPFDWGTIHMSGIGIHFEIANFESLKQSPKRLSFIKFIFQLSKIYLDMLNVYKVTSENISNFVTESGEEVLKQPLLKLMRAVKREILTLISTWVGKTQDPNVRFFVGLMLRK